ncbi:MAG: BatA and WFA domain-containing protein [Pirellulales bacterium]|nr:BatA and WFA domain-containing protein [Pirellulales bacterium]
MTFENPSAAWWALVAVPVLILYLIRLNVHREAVGTGMFWRQVLPKTNPILRRIASLLSQLVLITLLVAALTRLYLAPDTGSRRIVVYIDNSPSMATETNGETRLAEAVAHARKLVEDLRIGDQMAIFATAPVSHPVCRMTSYRRELLDTLDHLEVAPLVDRDSRPLEVAETTTNVIFIGDQRPPTVSTDSPVEPKFVAVGKSTDNVALTRIAARRRLFDPSVADVMIELRSYADREMKVPIAIKVNGAPLATEEVTLPANQAWRKTFRLADIADGTLTVQLKHVDAKVDDNELSVDLPKLAATRVRLIGEAPSALRDALARVPTAEVDEGGTGDAEIEIYYGNAPAGFAGPALVINPVVASSHWTIGEYQYDIDVAQDNNSPLLVGVALDDAVYERMRAIMPTGDVEVAATGASGTDSTYPLLFAIDGDPRLVVLAADLQQTDLAHRRDLPLLLANCLAWLKPLGAEHYVAETATSDHDLRVANASSPVPSADELLDYPWWHQPCWYFSILLALGLLPFEWWLYQRRIIA